MSEDTIGNLLGFLLLIAVIGLLAIWTCFGERRDEKRPKGRRKP